MNIKGRFVTLRAVTMEDQSMIVDMFNDPEIEKNVLGWAFPLSLDQQIAYFQKHLGQENAHRFVIETEEDGPVGIYILSDLDWKNRTATTGIKTTIGIKKHTIGIGLDAGMAIARYAFDELGLHRLNATHLAENRGAGLMAARIGWKEEGLIRSCVYKGGEWKDVISMGLLEEDYREFCKKSNYWKGGRKA